MVNVKTKVAFCSNNFKSFLDVLLDRTGRRQESRDQGVHLDPLLPKANFTQHGQELFSILLMDVWGQNLDKNFRANNSIPDISGTKHFCYL